MRFAKKIFYFTLLILTGLGCQTKNESDRKADSIFAQRTTNSSIADANSLDLIYPDSYRGISPGDEITAHEGELVKNQMKTGEGEFTIYTITDEQGEEIGYLVSDPDDKTRVGDITITSPTPVTTEGLHVGMTLGDLFNRYRNVEIHGSEVEGRTTVRKGQFTFRLDANFYTYDLDPKKLPLDTKVIEITINRPSEQ